MSYKMVTVELEDSLLKAFQLMRDQGIRHLPVTDPRGEIIGVLSDRDLQRAMKPHKSMEMPDEMSVEFDRSHRVRDFMSWPVLSVSADTPIEDVARRMLREKVSAYLVASRGGRFRGIITTDDLLLTLIQLLEKEGSSAKLSVESLMLRRELESGMEN